jgi:hypothetical protein
MERRNGPRSSFRGFCSPLARQGWLPRGDFRGGSFDRCDDLVCANPIWSKWLDTGFTLMVLTLVLSRLFTHVLAFEFQVGDLRNVWLIDYG